MASLKSAWPPVLDSLKSVVPSVLGSEGYLRPLWTLASGLLPESSVFYWLLPVLLVPFAWLAWMVWNLGQGFSLGFGLFFLTVRVVSVLIARLAGVAGTNPICISYFR
jgi:hypothetical protein